MKLSGFARYAVVVAVSGFTAVGWAQFPSPTIGFNSNNGTRPIDAESAQEMFRNPEVSASTSNPPSPPPGFTYIIRNTAGLNNNGAFRASGLQSEGDAALGVYFRWVDPADPDAWLRLTTFGGTGLPNPALHVDGKVRFRITNRSELFAGRVGLCLAIRETDTPSPILDDGGAAGTIEWVGVSTTPNAVIGGVDRIVNTAAAGDDVQVHPVGTDLAALGLPTGAAVIEPGLNGVINSVPAGDDQLRRGFSIDPANSNTPRPIPVAFLDPSPVPYLVEWNLATGAVSVDGVNLGGAFAPFTGDGNLTTTSGRGTLDSICFVNDPNDTAVLIDVGIDELRFESPTAIPFVAPRVVGPIINGQTTVTVTNLLGTANQVTLFRNGVALPPVAASNGQNVVVTLGSPALTGQEFTATQRDGGTNTNSGLSATETVLATPPPYGFSFMLDEDGDNCSFTSPGGWEDVGGLATIQNAGSFIHPTGMPVLMDSAVWQQIDFPLDDPDQVVAWLGGDGDVDASPTGFYGMDSIWFNLINGASVGPYEVLIDAIQVLNGSGAVVLTIRDFEDNAADLTQTRGQSSTLSETTAQKTPNAAYSGFQSQRLVWTFNSATQSSFGQLTRSSLCGTGYRWSSTDNLTIRFNMVLREPSANIVPLPIVIGPLVVGGTTVPVRNDATATSVQLYVNGVASGAPLTPTGTTTVFSGVTLTTGASISAKQVLPAGTSDFAYPQAVQAQLLPPPAATLPPPIEDGDTSVAVLDVRGQVTLVEILDSTNAVIGSTSTVNPDLTATVPLSRALIGGEMIRVRSTNTAGTTTSTTFEVGMGNGDILVSIGIRETGDVGALGTPGATAGPIEWLGASGAVSGAPQGRPISPSDNWQTLTYTPGVDPVTSFNAGNNVLDGTRGTLEHLAVSVNAASADRSTGLYEIYIDNVVNVGADAGGVDFLLSNFESFALGAEALFQEPNLSGSTAANLRVATGANVSTVTNEEGNPGQSAKLAFFFVDTAAARWVRLTTSGADNVSRPIIDITKPLRFDFLMRPAAQFALGDMNCDGVVSVGDIAGFVLALTNPAGYAATFPNCDINNADINQSGNISVGDIGPFVALLTGG